MTQEFGINNSLPTQPLVHISIVGAQKSGTTWLAESLDIHPSINLAIGKEAHLFDDSKIQASGLDFDDFSRFFPVTSDEKLNLDATPSYMYLDGCLKALSENNPSAKVIVILRDPGHRAISQYYHSKRLGLENKSLLPALLNERKRLRQSEADKLGSASSFRHHGYVDRGRYLSQVVQIKRLFPNSLFVPFPRLATEPKQVLEQVQRFLGLEVVDLPILPPLNNYGPRPNHPLIGALIRLLLKSDTNKTLQMLGWNKHELLERRGR